MSRNFIGSTASAAPVKPTTSPSMPQPTPSRVQPVRPQAPLVNPGMKQIDGNQSSLGAKPTRASLQDRPASPSNGRSGMENAMGALADKIHPPKFKGRR